MSPRSIADGSGSTDETRGAYAVLVVVTNEARLERVRRWLDPAFEVAVCDDRADALAALDRVDVVLLARTLPLELAPPAEDGPDDAEYLVTVVSDAENAELVAHCTATEYLREPIAGDDLRELIVRLRDLARYDDLLAELAELAVRRATYESTRARATLDGDESYAAIRERIDALCLELERLADDFEAADYVAAFGTPDFAGRPRTRQVGWLS